MPKKSGELRLYMHYKKLNQITNRNIYSIPWINEIFDTMKGALVFSKFDLKSTYNFMQTPGNNEYNTAFNTKFSHFEHLIMTPGLTNASAVF